MKTFLKMCCYKVLPSALLKLLVLISIPNGFLSVPLKSEDLNEIEAQDYLRQFGYMKKTPFTQQLVSSEKWSDRFAESLKVFQRFAGIQVTGKLDNNTKYMMTLPRCGVSDETPLEEAKRKRKKRYALQGSKWKSHELTYGIKKYPSRKYKPNYINLSKKDIDKEMKRALEIWGEFTPLKFKRVYKGRVQLDISFEQGSHNDGDPFDGYGGTLAHAYFPQYGGDAHFDDAELWSINSRKGTNLFQVAAHEFGHSLGLSHSDVSKSLMAPFYRGYDSSFRLHKDDIAAIQTLYGKREVKKKPKPTVETPEYNPDKEDDIDNTIGDADSDAPDLCQDSSVDAVVKTQNLFSYVFKGDYYWRILQDGLADGYPRKISVDWDGLPGNIDAALTWRDGRTFFFKGKLYWRFVNKKMHNGYPKLISRGFEGIPDNIDAAFVHSKNGKTYFFKDNQYWKFESKTDPPVNVKYPLPISLWTGVPNNIDAVFEWQNQKDYFFKGRSYYRLKKGQFEVDKNYPRTTSIWWFGCKADSETNKRNSGLQMLPELSAAQDMDDYEIEVRLDGDQKERNLVRSASKHNPPDVEITDEFERADIIPVVQEAEENQNSKQASHGTAMEITGNVIVTVSLLVVSLLLTK